MATELHITRAAAVTAVGLDAASTCAAMRCGLDGFAESAFFQDTPEPVPLVAAVVPMGLDPAQEEYPRNRVRRFAVRAMLEALTGSGIQPPRTALLVNTRETFDGEPGEDLAKWLLDQIKSAYAASVIGKDAPPNPIPAASQFHSASAAVALGSAGTIRLIETARTLLTGGQIDAALIVAADSLLNAPDLSTLESAWRLKREGVAQGLIPGEGAAAILLRVAPPAGQSMAKIIGIATADEDPAHVASSDGDATGRALLAAARLALADAGIDDGPVTLRVSDNNGETFRGMESMLVLTRLYRSWKATLPTWLPAMYAGETGAAAGALGLVWAATGFAKAYAPGDTALLESASDGVLRGCAVLRRSS